MRFGLFLAVFVFFTTAAFVEPQLASAEVSLAEYAGCSGTDCSACNVVNLANGVIKWLIGFLFLIFAVIMTFAGFGLVTSGGNHHALDEAKSRFVNAVIGLLLVLSAWLIVDTIMRGLVGDAGHEGQIPKGGSVSGWLVWSEVQCYSQATTTARTFTPENFTPDESIPGPASTIPVQGIGNVNLPPGVSAGAGSSAIVAYAIAMDNRQCQYSQSRRNSCSGTPGYTDCSELVHNAYLAAGCRSPGNWTGTIIQSAGPIGSPAALRAGDLLVRRSADDGHVVICMANGCAQVIHAQGRGAPDSQPATIAPANQITISGGSGFYGDSRYRVVRAAQFCPSSNGPQ